MGERRIGGAGERASGEYDADMGSGLGDEMDEKQLAAVAQALDAFEAAPAAAPSAAEIALKETQETSEAMQKLLTEAEALLPDPEELDGDRTACETKAGEILEKLRGYDKNADDAWRWLNNNDEQDFAMRLNRLTGCFNQGQLFEFSKLRASGTDDNDGSLKSGVDSCILERAVEYNEQGIVIAILERLSSDQKIELARTENSFGTNWLLHAASNGMREPMQAMRAGLSEEELFEVFGKPLDLDLTVMQEAFTGQPPDFVADILMSLTEKHRLESFQNLIPGHNLPFRTPISYLMDRPEFKVRKDGSEPIGIPEADAYVWGQLIMANYAKLSDLGKIESCQALAKMKRFDDLLELFEADDPAARRWLTDPSFSFKEQFEADDSEKSEVSSNLSEAYRAMALGMNAGQLARLSVVHNPETGANWVDAAVTLSNNYNSGFDVSKNLGDAWVATIKKFTANGHEDLLMELATTKSGEAGDSWIHYAAAFGDKRIWDMLKASLDANHLAELAAFPDAHGMTPMHLFIQHDRSDMASAIARQVGSEQLHYLCRTQNQNGETWTHLAAQREFWDAFAEPLLALNHEQLFDLSMLQNKSGLTVLHELALNNNRPTEAWERLRIFISRLSREQRILTTQPVITDAEYVEHQNQNWSGCLPEAAYDIVRAGWDAIEPWEGPDDWERHEPLLALEDDEEGWEEASMPPSSGGQRALEEEE